MRRTLNTSVTLQGVGLHSGRRVAVTVSPAAAEIGIVFHRADAGADAKPIPARYDHVAGTYRSTRLVNRDGLSVATVEHIMAALAGCGITDAHLSLDGPEVPIMDGSALAFVRAFIAAGVRELGVPAKAIRILASVSAASDDRWAALVPAPGFEMAFSIAFADPAIGTQQKQLALWGNAVVSELSDSRTFVRLCDVAMLRRMGLGRGGGLDNAVVVDNGRVLNPGGLRHPDEFIRHKMLDAVGDLALAGAPIIGRYVGLKAGHDLSNMLLRAVFARPDRWEWCEIEPGRVPGGDLVAPTAKAPAARIAV